MSREEIPEGREFLELPQFLGFVWFIWFVSFGWLRSLGSSVWFVRLFGSFRLSGLLGYLGLLSYLSLLSFRRRACPFASMPREMILFPPLAGQAGNTYPFQPSLGAAINNSAAVLRLSS